MKAKIIPLVVVLALAAAPLVCADEIHDLLEKMKADVRRRSRNTRTTKRSKASSGK